MKAYAHQNYYEPHTYNPSTQRLKQEALHKSEGSLGYIVLGQPGLQDKTLSKKEGDDDDDRGSQADIHVQSFQLLYKFE